MSQQLVVVVATAVVVAALQFLINEQRHCVPADFLVSLMLHTCNCCVAPRLRVTVHIRIRVAGKCTF